MSVGGQRVLGVIWARSMVLLEHMRHAKTMPVAGALWRWYVAGRDGEVS